MVIDLENVSKSLEKILINDINRQLFAPTLAERLGLKGKSLTKWEKRKIKWGWWIKEKRRKLGEIITGEVFTDY